MPKKLFRELDKDFQILLCTLPMSVFSTQEPDNETDDQTIASRDTFHKLSESLKYKLASNETSRKIQAIGQKYGFELLRLANITRLIREYYFSEVRFENFPTEIEKRMGVSLLTAQEITRYIKSEIIDWDPWAQYLAKLPKLPIREIVQRFPKIADTVITAGYIELKNSEDLEDPSIKNWLKDYISHLGYDRHSQMDRAQYLFHSENGKDLSSQDREKLGIILKSFDENIPLPVDEENGEIVFDGLISARGGSASGGSDQRTVNNNPMPAAVPKSQPTPTKQDSFIKPYSPIQQPQKQASRPAPAPVPTLPPQQTSAPVRTAPPQIFIKPALISQPAQEIARPNFATQPNRQVNPPSHIASRSEAGRELDKYFSAPEYPEIPSIKIHSITEHNEPKIAQQVPPRPTIQRPAPPQPQPNIHQSVQTSPQPSPYQGEGAARPKYKIIDPFFSKPMPEPRLDGNIVDLSANNDQ